MTVEREYFDWLCDIVCGNRYSGQASYEYLLSHLHRIPFRYSLAMDENRAEDGIGMRYRFARTKVHISQVWDIMHQLEGPCSVLEMLVALSVRCEEWMDDTNYGDRTGQWFWEMVVNLGLGAMTNNRYDEELVESAVVRFLDRDYERNGRGGLFTIKGCNRDLRKVQIWYQMCWYLDSIT